MIEQKGFDIVEFSIAFLTPTFIGKFLVIYFGMHYSADPGQGYGLGLAFSIIFTLAMVLRLVWKYRDYKD